jgi:hypothetical protein
MVKPGRQEARGGAHRSKYDQAVVRAIVATLLREVFMEPCTILPSPTEIEQRLFPAGVLPAAPDLPAGWSALTLLIP